MATIENTLLLREELTKSIEESKKILAAAHPGLAILFSASIEYNEEFYPHDINRSIWEKFLLDTYASKNKWEQKLLEMGVHHSQWKHLLQESHLNSIKWEKLLQTAFKNSTIYDFPFNKVLFLKTIYEDQSLLDVINHDITEDYKLFNEAGLFPKSQDLPHFIDLSSSYDDEKIETLNSELANLKNITDSDSEKIFQQTKSLSEAIQYDIIINTHTRKKKKLKRKVSIRNAHVIRQRYKSKQLKSLYDGLLSYSSKLNKENCYFFITVLNTIIGLPIPDKAKWFFAILLSPILYKAYVLSNHQTVLNEKQNTLEEQQK